jgi:hypothetical protein
VRVDRRRAAAVGVGLLILLGIVWSLWPRPTPILEVATSGGPVATRSPGQTPAIDAAAPVDPPVRALDAPTPGPAPATEADRAAALAELEADPRFDAVCALSIPLDDAFGHLLIGDPTDDPPYNGRGVPIVDGRAWLGLLTPEWGGDRGAGWLTIPGYAPVEVTWTGVTETERGTCHPNPVRLSPSVASVSGRVANAGDLPEGTVFVEGCGNQAVVDGEGNYHLDVAAGAPCRIQAFRREGMWASSSESVEIDPRTGHDRVVDFTLPDVERGGIGISVEPTEQGVRVTEVFPGGAADDLGLVEGDVVVKIDDHDVGDMPLEDFVGHAIGDAGTTLELTVRRGDAEWTLVVVRRAI